MQRLLSIDIYPSNTNNFIIKIPPLMWPVTFNRCEIFFLVGEKISEYLWKMEMQRVWYGVTNFLGHVGGGKIVGDTGEAGRKTSTTRGGS